MTYRIIPNYLRDEIYRRVDEQLEKCPDAAPDREKLYRQLLEATYRMGAIPTLSLVKMAPEETDGGDQ